jgi:hypothetical protein
MHVGHRDTANDRSDDTDKSLIGSAEKKIFQVSASI